MEGPLLHVLLRQLQQGLLGRAGSHQHSVPLILHYLLRALQRLHWMKLNALFFYI